MQDRPNPYYDRLEPILQALSETPGVYQFFDKKGEIIYIGKAKNLRARVMSYFRQDRSHNSKTRLLVRRIYDIKTIHLSTETEALLLECNLIKEYRPRYNILLKDDKSFPWIRITNEEFPKIFFTRNIIKDGSYYFGPYTSKRHLKELLDLIRRMFRYRTCSLPLTEESIAKGRFEICLNYQIKLCDAPCVGYQTKEDYNETINSIKNIIKGDFTSFIREMKVKMIDHAEAMEFEKAQEVKERIQALETYKSKSSIVSTIIKDVEVYAFQIENDSIYMNSMRVVDGNLISSYSTEIVIKLDENILETFAQAIMQTRDKMGWDSKEIILSEKLDFPEDYVKQTTPRQGERKKLLDLSQHNAKLYMYETIKKRRLVDPEISVNRVLETLKKDLRLSVMPKHIECFDNSNTQGEQPVSACVVFRDARPSKREYKRYNIKTVEGPDDYASMREVLLRRYSRLKTEGKPLPQLIIIDGGKGQLSVAVEILKTLELSDKISIIAIAEKLEEIYFPNDSIPLHLDKRSESLKLIQRIRDEAHRFSLSHHRSRRSRSTFRTELTDIPGIGEVTARELLIKFNSVKQISQLTEQQLIEAIGPSKAKKVYEHFRK